MSGHGGTSVETRKTGRVAARCECGWSTGDRASRQAALVALSAHIESMRLMSPTRAAAILNDHAHGLHEEYDGPDGCMWIGCAEAFFIAARDEERRLAESFSK